MCVCVRVGGCRPGWGVDGQHQYRGLDLSSCECRPQCQRVYTFSEIMDMHGKIYEGVCFGVGGGVDS